MPENVSVSIFPAWLQDYQRIINDRISIEFKGEISELDRVAMEEVSGGKRIRAVLAMLWCEAYCGDADPVVPIAVAYELAHAAALVQDDIIDNSDSRRGAKSLAGKYGVSRAILAANALLFYVPKMIAKYGRKDSNVDTICKLLDLLGDCCHSATTGEFLDLELANLGKVRESQYLNMIRLKTGALIAASCASGALIGGGPKNWNPVRGASTFGESLGIAYQIQDDILDFLGDESVLGKPAFTDIRNGKTSLVLIHLMKNCSDEETQFVNALIGRREPFEDWESDRLRTLLTKYGSADYARNLAGAYIQRGEAILKGLVESKARDRLFELSNYLASRNY
jgi:geranylgeranyl diphosphate synthase type I